MQERFRFYWMSIRPIGMTRAINLSNLSCFDDEDDDDDRLVLLMFILDAVGVPSIAFGEILY